MSAVIGLRGRHGRQPAGRSPRLDAGPRRQRRVDAGRRGTRCASRSARWTRWGTWSAPSRRTGYLTLRRVGATPVGPLFDQFLEGQRVTVCGRRGPVPGVVGVRSIHLARGRAAGERRPLRPRQRVRGRRRGDRRRRRRRSASGCSAPVTRAKRPHRYGHDLVAAPGAAAARGLRGAAGRGRAALPTAAPAVRRSWRSRGAGTSRTTAPASLLGSGAPAPAERRRLLGGAGAGDSLGLGAVLAARDSLLAGQRLLPGVGAGTCPPATRARPSRPCRCATSRRSPTGCSVPRRRAMSGRRRGGRRAHRLAGTALLPAPRRSARARSHHGRGPAVRRTSPRRATSCAQLVESYGVTGHEHRVRDAVLRLLPAWASPTVDSAGNLAGPRRATASRWPSSSRTWTRSGFDRHGGPRRRAPRPPAARRLLPVAVRGRAGAGAHGRRTGARRLRAARQPSARRRAARRRRSARGRRDAEPRRHRGPRHPRRRRRHDAQGVRAARRDARHRALASTTASAAPRSSSRCATSTRARCGAPCVFLWSVREETGLEGARFAAERLAPEHPARVYAVDTFVSSRRAARAEDVRRRAAGPRPRGAGGGQQLGHAAGAAATRWSRWPARGASRCRSARPTAATTAPSSPATAWPTCRSAGRGRYSHSPVEVLDLRDLVALADLIQTIVERW